MNMIKEGGSTTRPPVLDGINYAYWKARMTAFLKSIDNKTWKAVISSWEPPTITIKDKSTPKRESDWTDAEDQASLGNSRALNAIYNDQNVFKLINTCTSAKEAWKILEVAYEGTSKVKTSLLQLLSSTA
ncbi:gag-pol polyprotein [Cucumis melo var. makuwa]|uniref:Gag-pol polyprotein n=1 Tax=Cucumis melo var. makuwa TaxID=1194695 RepID=A0A5A7SP99_CUCMM|nr:gag-pol polyprotein [Cucumis melo var. makuwa]TYK31640.1 gag-pol polyprotein [Cucumis melo var. makuwa]